VADFEYHALIEFVNRLFTGVVTIAVAMAVLGSLRLIPRDANSFGSHSDLWPE